VRALTIAANNLRRFLRERSNVFFVFILPIAIIVLIGAQFGGDPPNRVGVVDEGSNGVTAGAVIAQLDEPRVFESRESLISAVERGDLSAGVVFPAGLDAGLESGSPPKVFFVSRPDGFGPQYRAVIERALAVSSIEPAAIRFVVERGAEPEAARSAAAAARGQVKPVEVELMTSGESEFPQDLGQFDFGASGQLVLFMFLTGLTGSAALIQTRQLGVSRRMLSTPSGIGSIVVGEGLGRFVVVMVQGVYIMVLTALVFGVDWGDPVGAVSLLLVFSAVAAGAAMLMGSLFRNDQQASAVAIVSGISLAALGGSMLPLDLLNDTMQTVAKFTPHGWANAGFNQLVLRNGTISDITVELGVLAAIAAVLLTAAGWRLRRVLTR
jgi:ABC-2 type transport system permease protein